MDASWVDDDSIMMPNGEDEQMGRITSLPPGAAMIAALLKREGGGGVFSCRSKVIYSMRV